MLRLSAVDVAHPSKTPGAGRRPAAPRRLRTQAVARCAGTLLGAAAALLCAAPARAQAAVQVAAKDLADLSLEELARLEVTSVSGKAEPLSGAPASIFVITNEDIRRSAATSLAEALRLAPNLQVARIDARNYAITARGSNGAFANKMLMMIDGRVVYTPLFSGVFWDAQDVMLEDVERIEVISGPGGTLWGSNAVNGVINVITRAAKDTQGGLLVAGTGSRENGTALRYGGAMANGGHYRVYGKYADYDNTRGANGAAVLDGWRRNQVGFRADFDAAGGAATVQGDFYRGDLHQAATTAIRIGGANLNARWERQLEGGSQVRIQAYYDHTDRSQPGAFSENLDTVSLSLQHALQLGSAHQVVWGAGYRVAYDRLQSEAAFAFLPDALDLRWGNVFVQDEIALRDNLHFTAGIKIETNSYTGAEYLPSLRLAWKPAPSHLVWGAVSRAVRAPSRIDRDLYSPTRAIVIPGLAPLRRLAGGPDFTSEVAKVYEIGYRGQPVPTLSYSVTAFYQDYDKLRTVEPGAPLGLNAVVANKSSGAVGGVEMWGSWQALPNWRLSAGYVAQHTRAYRDWDSRSTAAPTLGNDPSHYWTLRSSLDLGNHQELDISVRHMGALPSPAVPSYTALDLRYNWRVRPNLQVALIVQNLFDPRHPEFGTPPGYSDIGRSAFVKVTVGF